jgi:hypothetical protein
MALEEKRPFKNGMQLERKRGKSRKVAGDQE